MHMSISVVGECVIRESTERKQRNNREKTENPRSMNAAGLVRFLALV